MPKLAPLAALALISIPAIAQTVTDFAPPKANCCLPGMAQNLADQLQDWNQLGRYHADDAQLGAAGPVSGRVVFMGDSITDGWKLADSFPNKPYVNRGISGQTTPQMLVRMYPDVIDLQPAALVILAGTNDIARNTGPETLEMIEDNFKAMTELAQSHRIKVILCALTPVSDYTSRPQSAHRPPQDILQLNAWLKDFAAKTGAIYADYYSVTVDEKGFLKDGYSGDGLHPNSKGYALMAPVVQHAIDQALQ